VVMMVLQERLQLEQNFCVYGAQAIESNCYARMYFSNQSLKTAKELSEILGTVQFNDEKGIRRVRPLMTPHELKTMDVNSAVLLAGANPPILLSPLKPYFKSSLRKLAHLPTPDRPSLLPWDEVPLLPL
jgi:type IV secretory pathway TraG/TraD family ATPase VirD4